MPSHPIGRQILKYVDMPIAAPSANLSGRPSPTTFEHVYRDLDGRNHRFCDRTGSSDFKWKLCTIEHSTF
jgi:tRNA A37 threonylcarbamoyladenosine synthetase subunit TsaC/SUA5/YrdC